MVGAKATGREYEPKWSEMQFPLKPSPSKSPILNQRSKWQYRRMETWVDFPSPQIKDKQEKEGTMVGAKFSLKHLLIKFEADAKEWGENFRIKPV